MILINCLFFKKTFFFIGLLTLISFIYENQRDEDISYRLDLGIQVIDNSEILYNEINKFKKDNNLYKKDIDKIISSLNIKNSFLRYNFKGNSYLNDNVLIFHDKYLINKDKPIIFNNDDFLLFNKNEVLLNNNISNICSIHIIGYKGNDIIHMNTFDSFGIYLTKLDNIKDNSMICQNDKEWNIEVNSIKSYNIDEKYLNLINEFIDAINKVKHKNRFDSHKISEMIMSSNFNFVPNAYKKTYDDENILIDKDNNIIYSKKDNKNKIFLNKKNFLVLYQDIYGKIGHIGEIDSIDGNYVIVIKKEQATYIYDGHLSELRVNLITD